MSQLTNSTSLHASEKRLDVLVDPNSRLLISADILLNQALKANSGCSNAARLGDDNDVAFAHAKPGVSGYTTVLFPARSQRAVHAADFHRDEVSLVAAKVLASDDHFCARVALFGRDARHVWLRHVFFDAALFNLT